MDNGCRNYQIAHIGPEFIVTRCGNLIPADGTFCYREDAGTRPNEARGDASMKLSNDARNTILEHLKEALTWCADNRDWDAVLFIVTLMRKTHDEP
jgi:hypothetical protein